METPTNIRYVLHCVISYVPPDPTTAAAARKRAPKYAAVVFSVSQPAMLIQPMRKLCEV